MSKIIFTMAILFSLTSFAHEPEELSESEMVQQMFERDLNIELGQAKVLYDTVLSPEVSADKKCGYIDDLKKVLSKCDIGLNQYMGSLSNSKAGYNDFTRDPTDVSMRQIRAYQMQSRLNNFLTAVPIFTRNNNCQ